MRSTLRALVCALFVTTVAPIATHAEPGVDSSVAAPDAADVADVDLSAPAADVLAAVATPAPADVVAAVLTPALAVAATGPAAGPVFAMAAARPAGSFAYGTHVSGIDHAVDAYRDGFRLMSAYVPWQSVEPNRGDFLFRKQDRWGKPLPNALSNVVEAAAKANMKLVLRVDEVPSWAGGKPANLDPKDLEDYLYEVVRYGSGTIEYVEVLNEPNLPYEWGGAPDPAAYGRLLAGAYRGVKRANPNVQVISAAVSQRTGGLGGTMEDVQWLDGLYRSGAAANFDLLGMHAYLGNFAPEADPTTCSPMCFRDVELFRELMVRHGDGNKGAFVTEMGALQKTSIDLGPYAWMELDPDVRGDYLVRALQIANGNYPWLRGAMVFNYDYSMVPWNSQNSEKYWFSLRQGNGQLSPALARLSAARLDGRLS